MELKQRRSRIRRRIKMLNEKKLPRLCIYRSGMNIYGQLIDSNNGRVLVEASTLSEEFTKSKLKGYNVEGAAFIGKLLGEKAKKAGITEVVFDRSGYIYHGRIKALADNMREFVKI
jgi:large subunit ribosomal protein L18